MSSASKTHNAITSESLQVITSYTPKRLVTQDNVLINASYQMSLDEKRLVLLGTSKIDPREPPNESRPFEFDVNASEWHSYFGGSKHRIYEAMQTASEKLMKRQLEIKADPKRNIERTLMQWVDQCKYIEGEGRVRIKFGSSISVYLTGLVKHFTKVDLINVGALGSLYSIRIYELLSQFRDTGFRVQQIAELKEVLDIANMYSDYTDFKKRIIDPSVKEINEKTDLFVTWDVVKTGRKVTGLKFSFRQKEQMRLQF
jgi:plasmid replication initiation protein